MPLYLLADATFVKFILNKPALRAYLRNESMLKEEAERCRQSHTTAWKNGFHLSLLLLLYITDP